MLPVFRLESADADLATMAILLWRRLAESETVR